MNATNFEIANPDGSPTVQISYTLTSGPCAGTLLVRGTIGDLPGHGQVVSFDWYHQPKATQDRLRKGGVQHGQAIKVVTSNKPDLAALAAEALAAQAEAETRAASAAAVLEPIGYLYEIGCDVSDTHQFIWPDGVPWQRIERRLSDFSGLRDAIDRWFRSASPEEKRRVAEETGAEPVPATGCTYGGWRFGPGGLARLRELAEARAAEVAARKNAKQAARDAKVAAALAEASASGKRVLLESWTEPCDGADDVDECNVDECHRYAMPDGSIKVSRVHTF